MCVYIFMCVCVYMCAKRTRIETLQATTRALPVALLPAPLLRIRLCRAIMLPCRYVGAHQIIYMYIYIYIYVCMYVCIIYIYIYI